MGSFKKGDNLYNGKNTKPQSPKTIEDEAVENIVINDMPFVDKINFEYAETPSGMILDHAGRKEKGVPSSPRSDHLKTGLSARRFALTQNGEDFIKNYTMYDKNDIDDYMRSKGFSSPSLLFPDALSPFSKWENNHIVNEYVKEDNYNYLISNAKAIKTNIARVL